MGRPKKVPESAVRARLGPPRELSAAKRKLWRRQFDRFPPGFFVPADVSTMVLYLDWVALYDAELAGVKGAKDTAKAMVSLRNTARIVATLQRGLRMMPSTRTKADRHASLADAPTAPAERGKAPWEVMMENAGTLPRNRSN